MTKSLRYLALLAVLAVGALSLSACGTGTGAAVSAASSASAPAASHFKADLATGYRALEVAQAGTTWALEQHKLTADQAQGIRTQVIAFTTSLDLLRADGDTPSAQTKLTATLNAVSALAAIVPTSKGVPK
jgi:hypothetical protein